MTKHNTRNKRRVKKVRYLGIGGIAMGAGVAALAGGPAAGAAVARDATFSVSNGGPYKAHNDATNIFTDLTTHEAISCPAGRVTGGGSLPNGMHAPVGSVSSFNAGTANAPCSGPGAIPFAGHLTGGPWNISASNSSGGVVRGKITGIQLQASSQSLHLCSFSVTGSAMGSYTNATGVLSIHSANLTVHGGGLLCAGLVNSGDPANYSGPLTISNSTGGHPSIHQVSG